MTERQTNERTDPRPQREPRTVTGEAHLTAASDLGARGVRVATGTVELTADSGQN